jgi:hypothetical protein
MGWRLTEEMIDSGVNGAPYGSQTFCEVIAQQMNWTLKANSFDWLAKLPPKFLGRQVDFMTLGEAKKLQKTKFIKPADDKVFAAGVYAPGTLITHEVISDDTPTLVSDVVEFDLEYRTFVSRDEVLAWSNYIFFEHQVEPKMWNMIPADLTPPDRFVDDMLDDIGNVVDTYPSVIDVGRIRGKGWAIIETNQAWASGLYGCDPMGALSVIEDAVWGKSWIKK